MINYKDFAERMYNAIGKLIEEDALTNRVWEELSTVHSDYEDARSVSTEAPLPDWAESINEYREIKERAQLCTKDGRRCGNARVIRLVTKEQCGMSNDYWFVRTDVGTTMHLLTEEVNEMFHIGNYILKEGM